MTIRHRLSPRVSTLRFLAFCLPPPHAPGLSLQPSHCTSRCTSGDGGRRRRRGRGGQSGPCAGAAGGAHQGIALQPAPPQPQAGRRRVRLSCAAEGEGAGKGRGGRRGGRRSCVCAVRLVLYPRPVVVHRAFEVARSGPHQPILLLYLRKTALHRGQIFLRQRKGGQRRGKAT